MKRRKVLTCAGGGGEFLNRLYYGRNIIVIDNNRRGRCDNAAVTHRQH